MIGHVVTPVDGSPASWVAARVGASLARRARVPLTLVAVEYGVDTPDEARDRLERQLEQDHMAGVDVRFEVRIAADSVAAELGAAVAELTDPVVVMASHGRGRSSAIVGSVTEDVLRRSPRPVLLGGPHVDGASFAGPVVLAVDGSDEAEAAAPAGVDWAAMLGVGASVVQAVPPASTLPVDTPETSYVARLAQRLEHPPEVDVGFDEVPGNRPAVDLTDYAARHDASIIAVTTHNRTGFERLVMGSTAAGIVRRAVCPVLVTSVGDRSRLDP